MTSNEEQRIDQLEQALEQLENGADPDTIEQGLDPDVVPLFNLAARLERELPADLPDPEFRARLAEEMSSSGDPINLADRRPRHFLYDWRFGVAAAALAAIVLIALIYGTGTLEGNSPQPPARETVVSALSVSNKATSETGNAATPETVADTKVLPPIDTNHVVLVPLGLGAGGSGQSTSVAQPSPGVTLSTSLPVLPQTSPTWLLTGPDTPQEFLQTLMARVGLHGQIQAAPNEGSNAFVVVDSTGFPAIHWNQHDAFFRYDRGPNEPTPPPVRATTDPAVTAKDWLSEIGFDLTSIKYRETVQANADQTVVRFTPADLPTDAIPPGLGASVGVGPDGSIQFAQGFWLSLDESAEVQLRTSQETLDAVKAGEWYSMLSSGGSNTLNMDIKSAKLSYLLTRADDSSFLLQPVMAFGGERSTDQGNLQDTIYVSAIKPQ